MTNPHLSAEIVLEENPPHRRLVLQVRRCLFHLSLRWRLVLAFVLVSVPPAVVASFVAAAAISAVFEHNVEHWLENAVQFLANEVPEAEGDAAKAAGIVAAALAHGGGASLTEDQQVHSFADLLASVGYDLVIVYDDAGHVSYELGTAELKENLPQVASQLIIPVGVHGVPRLAVGAVRAFEFQGRRHFVLIADLVDEKFFGISRALTSLDVRTFRMVGGEPVPIGHRAIRSPLKIPAAVVASLSAGAPSAIASASPDDDLATAFAGLKDSDGRLIGIVSCRLAGMSASFERFGQWPLFLALAALAGFLSAAVGAYVAKRVSSPVQALTGGLRDVAAGRYDARVREEGGRELEELASGFNAMTEQLQRLRRMEDEMRRRQQLAALGEAAAVIAHEIRNPLGIIKTSSQVVRMKSALAPSEDRLIDFVLDEVDRIDRLVQDILDYVSPRQPTRLPVDIRAEVIDRVVTFIAPEAKRLGITSAVLDIGAPAAVAADADQLYQALLNLVLNAMDAMPAGGQLTITVDRDGDAVRIIVEDDGIGIDPEHSARIFDPFFTTKAKGTGLGLAKVQTIAEEHGGSIECRSEPGHGASFTIRLPALERDTTDAAVSSDRR